MELLAYLFIVLAAGDIFVTWRLLIAAERVREPALIERASVSLILTCAAATTAILSGLFLAGKEPDGPVPSFLFLLGLFLVSLPQYVWYVAYRTGRFR